MSLVWLGRLFFLAAILILCLTALGGITRLTGSGLSIPEWNLVFGIFPPLNEVHWQALFESYQKSPEFQKINFFMSVEDFKDIFWLEYWHRFFARFVFLLFLVGSFFFILKKNIPLSYKKVIFFILVLYMSQGVMGWIMVKSGLSKDPAVSPYLLGVHLLLAMLLYGVLVWNGLKIVCLHVFLREVSSSRGLKIWLWMVLFCGVATIFWGALVAGYKSGLLFPTFPKMGRDWIPSESWHLKPFWRNFLENPTGVYAVHRLLAFLTFVFGVSGCLKKIFWYTNKREIIIYGVPLALLVSQIALGGLAAVSHLFLGYAILHQINAFLLWGSFLGCLFYVSFKNFRAPKRL